MTVAELIAQLQNLDPFLQVVVRSGKYGFAKARKLEAGCLFNPGEDFVPEDCCEDGVDPDAVLID